MKKIFFGSLVLAFCYVVLSAGNANAQVTVIVTPEGQIVSLYGTNNSPILYQSGSISTSFRRLENMDLHYLPDTQEPDKIGNIVIGYESSSSLKGKVKRLGNLVFSYSTVGADSGKIRYISGRRITYDPNGRLTISTRFLEQGGSVELIIAPRL